MTSKDTAERQQVQIQVWHREAGEWVTPHQEHAALAALRAIAGDIADYSGSYSDSSLRKYREALRELDAVITKRIGPDA